MKIMARNDSNAQTAVAPQQHDLLQLADSCVKCGLCLPHCPTFDLARVEAESPRGRVGLIQGLAADRLRPGDALTRHLEQCLSCGNCESVCPANVRFGELMDKGRAELRYKGSQAPTLERALLRFAGSRRLQRLAGQISGLARLGQRLLPASLRRLAALLPDQAPARLAGRYRTTGSRGHVALFTGCLGPLLEPRALADSIAVLNAAGFDVEVPKDQACCGALALHAGYPDEARRLMARNIRAFSGTGADAVIFTASGCGATLREYGRLNGKPAGADFAGKAQDICHFLAGTGWRPPRASSPDRVAVHLPCTMKNAVGQHDATLQLLAGVADVRSLPGNSRCCGAAGASVVSHPAVADTLRAGKLTEIADSGATEVVTSNVGCARHLQAGLNQSGIEYRVSHPVSVLARVLRKGSPGVPDL